LGNWHQKWVTIGNYWKQTQPRTGRLFELGNNWEQQLSYGREAAAFLNSSNCYKKWLILDNWKQLRPPF
jgi:hypothetical protein